MHRNEITMREAYAYLLFKHEIVRSPRTIRNWIRRGILGGEVVNTQVGDVYYTTEAWIDEAVAIGAIPPRRGNPKLRRGPEEDDHDEP